MVCSLFPSDKYQSCTFLIIAFFFGRNQRHIVAFTSIRLFLQFFFFFCYFLCVCVILQTTQITLFHMHGLVGVAYYDMDGWLCWVDVIYIYCIWWMTMTWVKAFASEDGRRDIRFFVRSVGRWANGFLGVGRVGWMSHRDNILSVSVNMRIRVATKKKM